MKIALIITNLQGGGAEKAIINLAKLLEERGHSVCIITFENRCDYTIPQGVQWDVLTNSKLPKGWLGKFILARGLKKHLKSINPNLVISTLPFADEVTIKVNYPNHWCRIANTLSIEIEKLKIIKPSKAKRRFKRYQNLYSQRPLIAVSDGVRQDLRNYFSINSTIQTIANPFSFSEIHALANEDFDFKKTYVLHVGRFAPQKRHDVLLDAWQQLETDHQLVLLTHFDPKLEAMITKRNLMNKVTIAGFQKNPYVWMKHADLVALSSDHEGLPNVLIESLICGTSVVSTDCPSGPREILGDTGKTCLVPVGDAHALATAIKQQLEHPLPAQHIDLIRYSAEIVVQQYEKLGLEA